MRATAASRATPARDGESGVVVAPSASAVLGRRASGALVVQSAGLASKFGSQFVLARILGPGAFGSYTYGLNLGQLVAAPCDLGTSNAALRFVPAYLANDDTELLAGFVRTLQLLPLAVAGLVTAVAAGAVLVVGGGPVPTGVALVAVVIAPMLVLLSVLTGLTQGFHRVVAAYVPSLVLQPVALVVGAAGIFVLVGRFGAQTALVVTAISCVIAILALLVLVRRAGAALRSRRRRYAFREWSSVSLPLLVTSIVNLAFQRVDVLMVGLMIDARAAGIYAVAFRLAALVTILQVAMTTAIAPRISQLYWSGRGRELEQAMLSAIRMVLLPSVVLTVVLVAFGRPFLGVFGRDFRNGWTAMAVYAVGQLVSVSVGPVGWFLNLTGAQRTAAFINAATAAMAVVGYFVLIPPFGLVGAAASNALATATNNVWQLIVVRRRYGYRISPWNAMVSRRSAPSDSE